MTKALRFLAICTISVVFATLSIASAQTYTSIDFPGAVSTTLNGGPNPQGTSVGSWFDGTNTHGYTLTAKGVFTSFDPPGSISTTPDFISPQGVIVGGFNDASNVSHGFILNGSTFTTIDNPFGQPGTVLTGLNPSGEMSGFSCAVASCANGTFHSFTVSKKGVFASFDPPGAISSTASTVNPSGAVVGAYTDSGGVGHGYLLDKNGTFTTIDFPGATSTFAGGNNPEGNIIGEYNDTAGVGHSFLLSNGVFTSFDPSFTGVTVIFSDASGINPGGVIVGIYFDSAFKEHGYIRTP